MKLSKINFYIISIFPPPYRGVGVWNERIVKVLEENEAIDLTVYCTRHQKFFKKSFVQKIPLYLRVLGVIYTYLWLMKDMLKGNIGFKEYLSTAKFVFKIWSVVTQLDTGKKYCFYISHANLFTQTMLYVFKFLKPSSRVIVHEHGSGALEYAALRPNIVREIFQRADGVIVASNYMKEICQLDGCAEDKIFVVPCGINFQEKPYVPKDHTIMFCGSLEKEKDPLMFIKAIPLVLKRLKTDDLLFTLIGEGSLRGDIEAEVKKLGLGNSVKLYGELSNDDALRCYHKAKLFVLPSVREPFGIVILEAMSHYTPCIVTNVGGMPEIVDASFGKVVKERSPEQLAEAIVEIMEKDEIKYKEMSIMAYNTARIYDMKLVGDIFYKAVRKIND